MRTLLEEQPSGRWGHTLIGLGDSQVLLFGGGGEKLAKDACWLYKVDANQWQSLMHSPGMPPSRMGHSACYDPVCGERAWRVEWTL